MEGHGLPAILTIKSLYGVINAPRIKPHFGKHSFGNAILSAGGGGDGQTTRERSREEKTDFTKAGIFLSPTKELEFKSV